MLLLQLLNLFFLRVSYVSKFIQLNLEASQTLLCRFKLGTCLPI